MNPFSLAELGWGTFFEQQCSEFGPSWGEKQADTVVARVAAHQGSHLHCLTPEGDVALPAAMASGCGDIAVGDWLLLNQDLTRALHRLERRSLIERKAAGETVKRQPIAANVDTLFIVSSCNRDFNLSRFERYLAVAIQSRVTPVVLLTKADCCESPEVLRHQTEQLQQGLAVEVLDARDRDQARVLDHWCGVGQTVALVGSSGVGKSTLAMSLGAGFLKTGAIRESDARGRHTTTARSMHRLHAGGLLIDNPGMREFQLTECEDGLEAVFDEIGELADACRFRDCTHQSEPGCAVTAAISSGQLDARRLYNYQKLQSEQKRNTQTLHEQRRESRRQGRVYKSILSHKKRQRG